MQTPFFKKLGLDISSFSPCQLRFKNRDYGDQIQIGINPQEIDIVLN